MFSSHLSLLEQSRYLVICLFIGLLPCLSLKAQPWQWAKSGGGILSITHKEKISSIVTDSEGNVYFTSDVNPIGLEVDNTPMNGYGGSTSVNTALVSYTCDGVLRWSHIIGASSSSKFNRLQIDENDNIYLSGKFIRNIEVYLSSTTALPYSNQNNVYNESLFLMKYNNLGDLIWYKTPQPDTIDNITSWGSNGTFGLQTDPQGNSYWMVLLSPGTYANGNFENTLPGDNFFMLEYNTDGQFIAGHALELNIDGIFPNFQMIRNHNTGDIYMGGTIYYEEVSIVMGMDSITKPMFFMSFNENGDYLWKKENHGPLHGSIRDFVVDEEDNIYITGGTGVDVGTFAADTFAGAILESPYYGAFPFIIKLDPQGDLIWSTNARTVSSGTWGYAIAVNTNEVAITSAYGKLYWDNDSLISETNSGYDILFARFSKYNGTLLDLDHIPSNLGRSEYGSALASDKFDNFYVGGGFQHYLYVNDSTTLLNSAGGYDYVLAKYGYNTECNCDLPSPLFTNSNSGGTVSFTYTGTTPNNNILWDFGNGDTSIIENPEYTFSTNGTNLVCVSVIDDCGTAKYCTNVTASIGINEWSDLDIEFFQNKAENYLLIKANKPLEYYIYSIHGQKLEKGSIKVGENYINLFQLSYGGYIISFIDNEQHKHSIKFVK